jgi:hypothetical protein
MRIRFLTSVTNDQTAYSPGQVANVSDGANLVDAHFAIPEPPSPSGVIADYLTDNGYVMVTPDASGRITNPPADGGFCFEGEYAIRIVFPGSDVRFDMMHLKPQP